MAGEQRLTHVAVTVPRSLFEPQRRSELLAFYGDVFGWTENPGLAIPGERIFLRAPSDEQYLTLRASDEPMRTTGYEHLGVELPTPEELRELHRRARDRARGDGRVELGEIEVEYGGALHSFRLRFLLPLTIEVQCFVRAAS